MNRIWDEVNATTSQTLVDVANGLVHELPPGTPADQVQVHFMRRVIEEDAKQGVIWPQVSAEQHAAAGLGWLVFPNTVIVHGPTFALCYRARPNGYDPHSCIFEAYTLQRFAEGQEPRPENLHKPVIDEESWRRVLRQDFGNLGEVQKGMRSAGFSGVRPHPLEEQTVINFHRSLARYMGCGTPQPIE